MAALLRATCRRPALLPAALRHTLAPSSSPPSVAALASDRLRPAHHTPHHLRDATPATPRSPWVWSMPRHFTPPGGEFDTDMEEDDHAGQSNTPETWIHGHEEEEGYGEDVGDVSVALCDALLAARGNSKSRYLFTSDRLSKSYVKNLPIDVLKELCVEFSLPHSGVKKDVVDRLWAVAMPAHKVILESARKPKGNYPGNFPLGLRKGERGVEMEGGFDEYAQVDYSPDAHELRRPAPPPPPYAAAAALRENAGTGLFTSSLFSSTTEGSSLFPSTTDGSSPFATTTAGSSLFPSTTQGSSLFPSTPEGSSPFAATTAGSSLFPSTTEGSSPFATTTQGSSLFPSTTDGSSLFPSTPEGSSPFATTTQGSSLFPSTTDGSSPFPATTDGSSPFPATTEGSTGFSSSLFADGSGISAGISGINDNKTRRERIYELKQMHEASENQRVAMGDMSPPRHFPIAVSAEEVGVLLQKARIKDVTILHMKDQFKFFTDAMVIGTGTSSRHLYASANAVSYLVKQRCSEHEHEHFPYGLRPQGSPDAKWVAVDAGSVTVHLFTDDERKYYDLEELWVPRSFRQVHLRDVETAQTARRSPLAVARR